MTAKSRPELVDEATALGIEGLDNMTKPEIQKAIDEKQGAIDTYDDEPGGEEAPPKQTKADPKAVNSDGLRTTDGSFRVRVTIQKKEGDEANGIYIAANNNRIFVGYNQSTDIPEAHYWNLVDATEPKKTMVPDGRGGLKTQMKIIPAYIFAVHGIIRNGTFTPCTADQIKSSGGGK